jgi:hypothetical protein
VDGFIHLSNLNLLHPPRGHALTEPPFTGVRVCVHNSRVVRRLSFRSAVVLLTLVTVLSSAAQSAAAIGPAPIHQCGTFTSYRPPTATRSGELVIASTTYAAAWMGSTGPAGSTLHPFSQVIAAGVTPGSQACLDGTLVASQTEGNLLTDFTVSPDPAASTSPPTVTPLASATVSSSPQPQSQVTDLTFIWPLLVLAVLALVAVLVARNRRTTS